MEGGWGEPQRGAEMQSGGEKVGGTPGDHKGMKAGGKGGFIVALVV